MKKQKGGFLPILAALAPIVAKSALAGAAAAVGKKVINKISGNGTRIPGKKYKGEGSKIVGKSYKGTGTRILGKSKN